MLFNKLIRDKIPDKIKENGEIAITKTLSGKSFEIALNKKLLEEVKEVIEATNKDEIKEELADLLEVMMAKANNNDINFEDIEKYRIKKKNIKGGFDNKIFLVSTTKSQD